MYHLRPLLHLLDFRDLRVLEDLASSSFAAIKLCNELEVIAADSNHIELLKESFGLALSEPGELHHLLVHAPRDVVMQLLLLLKEGMPLLIP